MIGHNTLSLTVNEVLHRKWAIYYRMASRHCDPEHRAEFEQLAQFEADAFAASIRLPGWVHATPRKKVID